MARSVAEVVDRMRSAGWSAGVPVDEAVVRRLETTFKVEFPQDYREFLLLYGGGHVSNQSPLSSLWSVVDLLKLNERFRVPFLFPGLIGIGNEAFMLYALDYRDGAGGGIVSLGLSSSDPDDISPEADTFLEWLEQRLP